MKTVLWFTGLSGAGKTSLTKKLSAYLNASNHPTLYLDGDEIRDGLSGDLDFSEHGRTENIRRVAEMALLLLEQVKFIIVATISPTHHQRDLAKKIIGQDHFKLIYLSTPLNECIKRDPKGHYARAKEGQLKTFTGISAPFDVPQHFDLELDTSLLNEEVCMEKILNLIE